MYDMDVGCSLKGSTASTIVQWDHFHTYITYDFSTVAHDVNALAEKNDDAGLQLRINAMVEQERLEDNGIGDELMEMCNALAD